jgi:NADH-quinone oxidoreductase subunit N
MTGLADLMGSYAAFSPLLWVAMAGLVMMVVDALVKERAQLGLMTFFILLVGGGLSLALWDTTADSELGGYLATDHLALFIDVVVCAGGALAALLAGGYLHEHGLERGEYYLVLLFSTFGAMTLGRASDLLSLFVALETLSLGVYGLVAYRRHSPRSAEGAMKYFLLGSFASAILLFGSALLYGATHATSFAGIGSAIEQGTADLRLVILGMALLMIGLAFKVSAVPFHMWTPDAYEGAVTPATSFMAVVVKAATFAVVVRVFVVMFGTESLATTGSGWLPALAGLSALTMVVGNVAALSQKNVKRMLAYSSIAHGGFILIGVVAAGIARGTSEDAAASALSSVLYYLLAYTASNILAFGALIWAGSRGKEAVTFDDLAGLGRRHPMVALPFSIGILSLMGFPPTAGFFAKYYVLSVAVQQGGGMVWLAILGVLSSAVGAYYYLKVLVYLFMKQPDQGQVLAVPMRSFYVVSALVLSTYFVLRMGIAPDHYLQLALSAAHLS